MKLRYYLDKDKKVYTLKNLVNNKPTKEAHYKFVKLRDVQED